MKTVSGVGLITAMTYRTELIVPERFKDGREVARMLGLAPQVKESGETRKSGRLMKSGNWRVRTILTEASWRWVAKDPYATELYKKLVCNTGNSRKAIVGVARKLSIILWRMVTREEKYRKSA